jgi:hypothetical protein
VLAGVVALPDITTTLRGPARCQPDIATMLRGPTCCRPSQQRCYNSATTTLGAAALPAITAALWGAVVYCRRPPSPQWRLSSTRSTFVRLSLDVRSTFVRRPLDFHRMSVQLLSDVCRTSVHDLPSWVLPTSLLTSSSCLRHCWRHRPAYVIVDIIILLTSLLTSSSCLCHYWHHRPAYVIVDVIVLLVSLLTTSSCLRQCRRHRLAVLCPVVLPTWHPVLTSCRLDILCPTSCCLDVLRNTVLQSCVLHSVVVHLVVLWSYVL